MLRRPRKALKDYLVPHSGNGFKPLLFAAGSIATLVVAILLVQAAYLFHTNVVFTKTNFLASVLPGVLATLTNEDRKENGAGELMTDALLAKAAQMKADDMAAKGYFAHVDPEGRAPWYWLQKAGYAYTYAGENLAVDFVDSEDVEVAWMNSPTHRANIVKPQYTRIGIGTARGTYQGKETTFVVQFFATPKAAVAPAEETVEPAPVLVSAEESPSAPEPVPVETPADTEIAVETVPADAQVLGAESEPLVSAERAVEGAQSFVAQVAASPTHTVIYVLSVLFAVFALLMFFALFMHARVQYVEVIGGGLIVLLVAFSLIAYDSLSVANVAIPEGAQTAAAIEAF